MSVNYNISTVSSNLLICLDPANPRSYPGTGTKYYDVTNNISHTLAGGANYTTLNGVQCINCNVSGYYIECDISTVQLPTTGYTYIAWARLLSTNNEWRTLFRTTPDDHPLLIQSGGVTLGMFDNNSTSFNSSGYDTSPWNSVWAQWTVVGDTTNGSTFYINGSQVGTSVAQSAGGNYHKWLGGAAGSQPFGYLGWIGLYNTKLTLAQITQNYNALRGRYGV